MEQNHSDNLPENLYRAGLDTRHLENNQPGSVDHGVGRRRPPWNYGFTLLFAVLAIILNLICSFVVILPYVVYIILQGHSAVDAEQNLVEVIMGSGTLIGISIMAGAVGSILFLLLVVWLRRGPGIGDYFGFNRLRTVPDSTGTRLFVYGVLWTILFFALVALLDYLLAEVLKVPVPEFMQQIACAPDRFGMLLLGGILVGPVFEELLVRGFWFRTLEDRSLVWVILGGLILPNLVWALLHGGQYEWLYLVQIFLMGIVLSLMRYHLHSIWPGIILHVSHNAIVFVSSKVSGVDCTAQTVETVILSIGFI